jgi:cyclopropane fatty-acyl-phospholipid synthase-like methyltransferase
MAASQQELVRAGYNVIAKDYLAWIQQRPTAHHVKLQQILEHLDASSRVLELGCGAGLPVTQVLTQHVAEVVANDNSEEQIALAKSNAPRAKFIHGDMTQLEFPSESFDAVVAFYSFFHVPREQHETLIKNVCDWLRKGGLLLFTYSSHAEEGIYPLFLGTKMYFSSFGTEQILDIVKSCGFTIVEQEVRAQGNVDDPTDPDNDTSFLWILARKP